MSVTSDNIKFVIDISESLITSDKNVSHKAINNVLFEHKSPINLILDLSFDTPNNKRAAFNNIN